MKGRVSVMAGHFNGNLAASKFAKRINFQKKGQLLLMAKDVKNGVLYLLNAGARARFETANQPPWPVKSAGRFHMYKH